MCYKKKKQCNDQAEASLTDLIAAKYLSPPPNILYDIPRYTYAIYGSKHKSYKVHNTGIETVYVLADRFDNHTSTTDIFT